MARPLNRIIEELRQKAIALAMQRDQAVSDLDRLKQENETLKEQLSESRQELTMARMEVDFLTISHRLADSPEKIISARRRLQRLIAKIDRCVTLLKEDADIS
ncbi:MAG: hypothetical protein K2N35_15090 [Muribaculaceae bacterium]|nr:hypothetical protein [Muribaculaceae bacterium]